MFVDLYGTKNVDFVLFNGYNRKCKFFLLYNDDKKGVNERRDMVQ